MPGPVLRIAPAAARPHDNAPATAFTDTKPKTQQTAQPQLQCPSQTRPAGSRMQLSHARLDVKVKRTHGPKWTDQGKPGLVNANRPCSCHLRYPQLIHRCCTKRRCNAAALLPVPSPPVAAATCDHSATAATAAAVPCTGKPHVPDRSCTLLRLADT